MQSESLSLATLWAQADGVTRGVALALLVMSVGSWCVIAGKLLGLAAYRLGRGRQLRAFWGAPSLEVGLAGLPRNSLYAQVAAAGVLAARQYRAAPGREGTPPPLTEWLSRALRQANQNLAGRLQAGMAVLATVGSSAPFVGLLGTVWGIYHALAKIGVTGAASIDKVAGPVGETLIMTALGLAVAIPATLGYNLLVRSNKQVLGALSNFAFELHDVLVLGARATPRERAGAPLGQAEYA